MALFIPYATCHFFVSLGHALQPFGRALVEVGKAFFGMEQEKRALWGLLEYEMGKCFDQLRQKLYEFCASVLITFSWCYLAL